MKAQLLTTNLAQEAQIELIADGKGTQAVHDVVVAMRANRRSGTASVKTKAMVNLTGKKPWRQKGTGRARAGYKSSPVWVGGGVAHGPHPRSYAKKTTKGVKKLALRKALSSRIIGGDIFLVDQFEVVIPKTKEFLGALRTIDQELNPNHVSILIVGKEFSPSTFLSARNVVPVLLMSAEELNTEHLLSFDKVILTQDALALLAKRLEKKASLLEEQK